MYYYSEGFSLYTKVAWAQYLKLSSVMTSSRHGYVDVLLWLNTWSLLFVRLNCKQVWTTFAYLSCHYFVSHVRNIMTKRANVYFLLSKKSNNSIFQRNVVTKDRSSGSKIATPVTQKRPNHFSLPVLQN